MVVVAWLLRPTLTLPVFMAIRLSDGMAASSVQLLRLLPLLTLAYGLGSDGACLPPGYLHHPPPLRAYSPFASWLSCWAATHGHDACLCWNCWNAMIPRLLPRACTYRLPPHAA